MYLCVKKVGLIRTTCVINTDYFFFSFFLLSFLSFPFFGSLTRPRTLALITISKLIELLRTTAKLFECERVFFSPEKIIPREARILGSLGSKMMD